RWRFFFRFLMTDDDVEYFNGTWEYHVIVHTGADTRTERVGFELLLDANLERPWVLLHTSVHGKIFNGSTVVIEGTAYDDYQLLLVEVRIDSGEWETVGTAEEWTYSLDTGALGEGFHTIDFRAFDGLRYSYINANSFEVRFEDDPPGNGNGSSDPEWNTQMYLLAGGAILMAIVIGLVVALAIVKARKDPDT
ncbi:MAG: Ig-like domain-containing protein, partial [Candidatus Thermoplasmatota archaeon]|nr:Ig-like domain-containing protein [Candidatus Thermoplasmatota archaeon]